MAVMSTVCTYKYLNKRYPEPWVGSTQTDSIRETEVLSFFQTALRQLLFPFKVETIFTIIFLYHHTMNLSIRVTLHDYVYTCTSTQTIKHFL